MMKALDTLVHGRRSKRSVAEKVEGHEGQPKSPEKGRVKSSERQGQRRVKRIADFGRINYPINDLPPGAIQVSMENPLLD